LDALEKYGIKILRTDKDGDIQIICNSQSLKLKLKG
jgi:beta-lactamase superfamily II metal-dependent hydrolase